MKTEIFIMTHKKFLEPAEPGYIPLHVGRAVSQDLGYIGDDTGDHISEQNCYYGELTGLYWLWKNYHDTDIIGICHYRRFFVDQEGKLMPLSGYEEILKDHDVITSDMNILDRPCKDVYGEAHNPADLLETGEVIRELYPEYYSVFCDTINDNKSY